MAFLTGGDKLCAGFLRSTGGDCVFCNTVKKSNVVRVVGCKGDRECGEYAARNDRTAGVLGSNPCGKG